MKNKSIHTKPSVTVVVSALNEERNIKPFIQSVLMQKEDTFKLESILIFSDGSTDRTVEMAQSFRSSKVKVFAFTERLGKSTRLNQSYKMVRSDYYVQSDADVVFSHENVINDLIMPMVKNHKIAMCSGNPLPIRATTFTEQAVNYTFEAHHYMKEHLRKGNNVFTVAGTLLAFRTDFLHTIELPKDVMAEDVYLYFSCIQKKYLYEYVPSAIVYFRSPQNLRDQIKQNTRFMASEGKMLSYFDADLVKRESRFPQRLIISRMIMLCMQHPVHCAYIFLVNTYCRLQARKLGNEMTATWQVAQSTKLKIT